ncbi:short-chain collagen C4-like [Watersipora subatra]|uniref:short-chain collagen C4-like n=1 Tax=Watersipora subatra TaxID=2589382 RepID=UPI00355BD7C9
MSLIYLALLILTLTTCHSNAVVNEAVIQLQADMEDLKGVVASIKTFMEEAAAGNNPWETKVGPPGPPGPPGIVGRDGRDGADGTNGRDGVNGEKGGTGRDGSDGKDGADGRDGVDGRDGINGVKGEAGTDGSNGRDGADGNDGVDGLPGRNGLPGPDGEKGAAGKAGKQGNKGAEGLVGEPGRKGEAGPAGKREAIYTRWGRTSCGSDASLVYEGFTGSSRSIDSGGGVNYLCMATDVEYNSDGAAYMSLTANLAGAEYESGSYGIFSSAADHQKAPCAVCYVSSRSSVMTIPGKRNCPNNDWTFEYEGYLMSAYHSFNHQTTFECVDGQPEYMDGKSAHIIGAQLEFTTAKCDEDFLCPPYESDKPITCVVCTK